MMGACGGRCDHGPISCSSRLHSTSSAIFVCSPTTQHALRQHHLRLDDPLALPVEQARRRKRVRHRPPQRLDDAARLQELRPLGLDKQAAAISLCPILCVPRSRRRIATGDSLGLGDLFPVQRLHRAAHDGLAALDTVELGTDNDELIEKRKDQPGSTRVGEGVRGATSSRSCGSLRQWPLV